MFRRMVVILLAGGILGLLALPLSAQTSTTITYQGYLDDNGAPANGVFNLTFRIYDVQTGGTALWTEAHNGVTIADGLFKVALGSITPFNSTDFESASLYLEITVGTTTLSPRQPLTASPYSLRAAMVDWAGVTNMPADFMDGVDNIGNDWTLGGNAGTVPGTNFIGTTDSVAFQVHVNGNPALRIEPIPLGSPNIIGGIGVNTVTSGAYGATISGGGGSNTSSPDERNRVTDHFGTVGGGVANRAGNDDVTFNNAWYATVAGGTTNIAGATGATVAGGGNNSASGLYATVAGGNYNLAAGNYSFVAGRRAKNDATHSGVFLFADSTTADFNSAATNEFAVRAGGGVRFVVGATTCTLTSASGTDGWACGGTSSRDLKTSFQAVDTRAVLDAVAQMPVTTWTYDGTDVLHMGPMAQDFHSAFGLGSSDQSIEFVDANGVSMAAIQGLYDIVNERDVQVSALQADLRQTRMIVLGMGALMLVGMAAMGMFMLRQQAKEF